MQICLTQADSTYDFITGYSITSDYLSSQVCTSALGPPHELRSTFSVTRPATPEVTAFSSSVMSQFQEVLGFTACENGATPQVEREALTPTGPSNAQATETSDDTPTVDPTYQTPLKITIAVSTLFGTLAIVWFGLPLLRHLQKQIRQAMIRKGEQIDSSQGDSHPYLQPKAELEGVDTTVAELETRRHGFELDGDEIRAEMQSSDDMRRLFPRTRSWLPSFQLTHELFGEEFARELECP